MYRPIPSYFWWANYLVVPLIARKLLWGQRLSARFVLLLNTAAGKVQGIVQEYGTSIQTVLAGLQQVS